MRRNRHPLRFIDVYPATRDEVRDIAPIGTISSTLTNGLKPKPWMTKPEKVEMAPLGTPPAPRKKALLQRL